MSISNPKNDIMEETIIDKKINLLNQMRQNLTHYKKMIDFFEPVILEREVYAESRGSSNADKRRYQF